ncbi:MAG: porin family protein [Sulfurovum sp.]|nr:porin family protein [Sulfurovum sp.]
MKHTTMILSVTLLLSTTTLAQAGSKQVAPVEAEVLALPTVQSDNAYTSSFYLGLGASALKLDNGDTKENFKANAVTLQAGYDYNKYLGIEGRYSRSFGNVKYDKGTSTNANIGDYPTDFTNIALYLKPQYKLEKFSAYALLGYGEVALTNIPQGGVDRAEAGFQWGLGLSYDITNNISVFADYTNLYEGKGFNYIATNSDITVDAATLGFLYKF